MDEVGICRQVFRTYNASFTLERLLAETEESISPEQMRQEGRELAMINFYQAANKRVAELCNHQRAAPKNFGDQVSWRHGPPAAPASAGWG